jgi:two-component system response regulator RegA
MSTAGHILLVDDDEILTHVLNRAFTRRGFHVLIAHDAANALDFCEQTPCLDKVVLDLKLAGDSGLALIPQLLAVNSGLSIVVLTGYSSIATAVEAIKLGARNYLCKPADADEILASFEEDQQPSGTDTKGMVAPSLDRLEWEYIQKVLTENNDNISATARALNMHRRTLQRKLNKFPVKR